MSKSLLAPTKLGTLTDLMLSSGYCTDPNIMSVDSVHVENPEPNSEYFAEGGAVDQFIRVDYRYKDCDLTGQTVNATVYIRFDNNTAILSDK